MPEINGNNSPINTSQQPTVSEHDTPASDVSGKSRHGQSVQQVKPESIFSRIKTFFGGAFKDRAVADRKATVVHTAKDVIPEMIPGKVEKLGLEDVDVSKTEVRSERFGKVYPTRAKESGEVGEHPQKLQKNYVVKKHYLKPGRDNATNEAREKVQLQKEAKGAVPVVDEELDDIYGFFAAHNVMMEHGGQTLSELTRPTDVEKATQLKAGPDESPMPLDEGMCRAIGTELFKQLANLHEQNVVHRDIKPANVLINNQGKARLADFGAGQKAQNTTASGDSDALKYSGTIGTPTYMAPEVAEGGEYSEKVDCWSTGMMLLELLTGEVPASVYQRVEKIDGDRFNFAPGSYRALCDSVDAHPHLSPEAKETILSLIALDPSDRPSARDVLNQPFFQVGRTRASGAHFQLQAQHREKFHALAELEQSLEALEKREAADAPKKHRSRKSRGDRVKTREMVALEREIQVAGLEVKSLQAKMELEGLYAEVDRLEKRITVVLEGMSPDYAEHVMVNLDVRIAVTKRDAALKELAIKHMDSAVAMMQRKGSIMEQLAEREQHALPESDIEPLKKQAGDIDVQLQSNDLQYQLDCLKVEKDYFTENAASLTKKQKVRAKKIPSMIEKQQKLLDNLRGYF